MAPFFRQHKLHQSLVNAKGPAQPFRFCFCPLPFLL